MEVSGNNISYTYYQGIHINYSAPYTYVYNNTLTKCNYYGADSTGDWDYASIHVGELEEVVGSGTSHDTVIDNNTISDGINGIQTWSDDCTVTNNTIYDMGVTYADTKGTAGVGDGVYYNSGIIIGSNWLTGNLKPTGTTITGNNIHDNYHGLYVRDYATLSPDDPSVLSVTAEQNWWGDATGPFHTTSNPGGLGDAVSDNVDFEPWKGQADIAILPVASGPINCSQTATLTFHYTPDAMSPDLRGCSVTFRPDNELSMTINDVTNLAGFNIFYAVNNDNGTFTVDGSISTGTLIDVETDLFSVVVGGAVTGTADVQITDYHLRDTFNEDFFAGLHDATVEVDCIAPGAATDLAAEPGHEKVTVTWTDPGDADLDLIEIWRGAWHDGAYASAYPEYDDLPSDAIPTRPADRAAADASPEWVLAGTALPTVESFVDNFATRGVYYYEIFVMDTADNYGPPTAGTDRATNYWLADVAAPSPPPVYDGLVNVDDITDLGTCYGTDPTDTGLYNNEVDVGPTDDHSGMGIPATDNYIGFEDMMIFALNYSVVNPLPRQYTGGETPVLAWYQVDEQSWALALTEPCLNLKALHIQAQLPSGVSLTLSEGSMLDRQADPVFFQNVDGNGLDLGMAVMGAGLSFSGSGELFRVRLSEPVQIGEPVIDARDSANEALDFALEYNDPMPTVYQLARNFPNPFNPKTTIRFDLPEAQDVRLVVFDANGRLIHVLVDEARGPGYHAVDWNGIDERGVRVSSGIYFYRIEAGPLSQTAKMLLMK